MTIIFDFLKIPSYTNDMEEQTLPVPFIDNTYENLAHVQAQNCVEPTERDISIIEEMAAIGCTPKEICQVLKIPQEIFRDHPLIKPAVLRGAERQKVSLRRLQWKTAQKNPIMQIFLGKQILGQADKVEHKNDESKELERARQAFADKLKNIIDVTPKRQTARTTKRKGSRSREVPVESVGERRTTSTAR